MFDKLDAAENRYGGVKPEAQRSRVVADQDEYRKLMKEFSGLEEIVSKYREYKRQRKISQKHRSYWTKVQTRISASLS